MQTEYSVLGYRIDCFHGYKLAIEIDQNGYSDRSIDYEIKRQKAIKQELGCEFIRNVPGKVDFDIFEIINEIFRQIKGTLSGLSQFLVTESPLKMMKNAFVLKVFKLLS